MPARHVVIAGRVQGVGFRDWMRRQAQALGISGWVRNTRAGTVEALLDGDPGAVAELLRVDVEAWRNEVPSMREHFARFGAKLPQGVKDELEALVQRLEAAAEVGVER